MSQPWGKGSTRAWRNIRSFVLWRDNRQCQIRTPGICITVARCVDHIIPKSKGGTDDPQNLRASCVPCNLHRGNTQEDEHRTPFLPITNW